MFHLYCPQCNRAWPLPVDSDAIILLCPLCPTRRELRSGPAPSSAPPESIQATPPPVRTEPRKVPPAPVPATPPREGVPLAEYPIVLEKIENFAGCAWVLMLAGGSAGILALLNLRSAEGDTVPWLLLLALAGGLMLLVGLGFAVWARENKNLCVRVLPDGLERTWGREVIRCTWDDVNAVYESVLRWFTNGAYTKTTHEYRVLLKDGREMVFDDQLQNVAKLGETIMHETFQRMMPRAIQTLAAGGTVPFGWLEVTPDGLIQSAYEGKDVLPWTEVNNVDVNSAAGSITISRKTGKYLTWWQGSTSQLPNVMVFLNLLDRFVGVTRT
jgi:hypothetical protein